MCLPAYILYFILQGKKSTRKEMVSLNEVNLIDLNEEKQQRWDSVDKGGEKASSEAERLQQLQKSEDKPETDAERLKKLKAIRETLRQAQTQLHQQPGQGAAGSTKAKGEKYRWAADHVLL